MSHHHETNPHFLPPQQPQYQDDPHPQPQHGSSVHFTPQLPPQNQNQNRQAQQSPTPHSPAQRPPQPRPHRHRTQNPQSRRGSESANTHFPLHPQLPQSESANTQFPLQPQPQTHPQQSTQPIQQPGHPHYSTRPIQRPDPQYSNLEIPRRNKTPHWAWLIGAFCALFWIVIILGGLVILVVYLIFRPRSPKFDVAGATLNAAYLDMGHLLNADMTLLANFTNPSKKATVDFSSIVISLYYEKTLIATSYVDPLSEMQTESSFRNVHLVSSQVWLTSIESQQMRQQMERNRVRFEVKGLLRTRSNLGSFLKYQYWLYGHCIIEVTAPPSGVLIAKTCITKR